VGHAVTAKWMMPTETTTISHVGWFTMQHKRNWSGPVRVCSREAMFRVYLVHLSVRSMSKTFRVYLLNLSDSRNCHGQARTSDAATFRMYLLHLDSMRNEHARRLIHKQPMYMALTLIQIQIQSFHPSLCTQIQRFRLYLCMLCH
jgi:hypothetical protein